MYLVVSHDNYGSIHQWYKNRPTEHEALNECELLEITETDQILSRVTLYAGAAVSHEESIYALEG